MVGVGSSPGYVRTVRGPSQARPAGHPTADSRVSSVERVRFQSGPARAAASSCRAFVAQRSPPPVWRFLPRWTRAIRRRPSPPQTTEGERASRDMGARYGREQVVKVGERPHGPGAHDIGALDRGSLPAQPRGDGRCRTQLVADAYRHSRWTRWTRADLVLAERERRKRETARRTLPSRQVLSLQRSCVHEPRCMPPLQGYSIPECAPERKRKSRLFGTSRRVRSRSGLRLISYTL